MVAGQAFTRSPIFLKDKPCVLSFLSSSTSRFSFFGRPNWSPRLDLSLA
jgi:hypothetical protein